ncbi:MAG: DUF58 domain-containing protein [Acidimicrobiales bacterium]|nr:MAG: DUF58 domain-containing protein [Acidimicrobiales bacterium]
MTELLTEIRLKLSIHAHRKVRGMLDGEYGSVYKGRSMDFEDLREYVAGDDIKDVDWKATARSGHPLIKRFVAVRKHTIMLVVSTGRNMAAMADPETSKREVTVFAAGVLGLTALRHGDLVSLVAGDSSGVEYVKPAGTTMHLERLLRTIVARTEVDGPAADLAGTLQFIARNISRRSIIVLLADAVEWTDEEYRLLRRLSAQHEVIYVRIGDISPADLQLTSQVAYDVASLATLPAFVRHDRTLHADYAQTLATNAASTRAQLSQIDIASGSASSEADVIPAVFELLERHRRARRG